MCSAATVAVPVESKRPIMSRDGISLTPSINCFGRMVKRERAVKEKRPPRRARTGVGGRPGCLEWTARGRAPERLLDPAVYGPDARLGDEEIVADRLAAPALDHPGGRHQPEQIGRLVAVVRLGVGVHLEVPHPHAVVLLEPLVERLRVPTTRRYPLPGVAEYREAL